jgi:Skp family chaperone for outer membrane proteins
MPLRLLLSLSLLLAALSAGRAQTAEDFFHGGAMLYLSNNIPKAKEEVAAGRKRFPDDIKLKKLEELLNQQQQSQSQQQQQQQEKQDQEKQDSGQQEQQQEKQQGQQQPPDKSSQQKDQEQERPQDGGGGKDQGGQPAEARTLTPQEAKQLLDAQKGEEQFLQLRRTDKPERRARPLKDW